MRWFASLTVALALCGSASADLETAYLATCKVHIPGGRSGSGCCYAIQDGFAYVLTNAHVGGEVGSQRECVFIRRGYKSQRLPAVTVFSTGYGPGSPQDAAVLKIDANLFGGYVPPAIPIIEEEYKIQVGQTVATAGSPNGEWPSVRVGHVLSADSDIVVFTPPSIPGQSGSALFNEDGTRIVGLIAWGNGSTGLGMTNNGIRRAIRGDRPQFQMIDGYAPLALETVQCPDGNCRPGGSGPINPRPQQPGSDGGAFPGLPDDEPIRPAPTVPINPPKVEPPAPPVKGCECDNASIMALIAKIDARQASFEQLLVKIDARQTTTETNITNIAEREPPEAPTVDMPGIVAAVVDQMSKQPIRIRVAGMEGEAKAYLGGKPVYLKLSPITPAK
jgi:hypothetical protein